MDVLMTGPICSEVTAVKIQSIILNQEGSASINPRSFYLQFVDCYK